jgi:hypothetical protein
MGLAGEARKLSATFDLADDLLWQAVAGRLPHLGSLAVSRSGRIGPLVEMAIAVNASPSPLTFLLRYARPAEPR